MKIFDNFYANKRVLITGHGGFKGAWLAFWLTKMGAHVAGYSLLLDSKERMYDVLDLKNLLAFNVIDDICNASAINAAIKEFQPEIIFHMAAQSLVRPSYANPMETYASNVMGTLFVLEAARKAASVQAFVTVTTDKCYENKESDHTYQEDDPLGGHDMYSSSKACAEILASSYRRSFLEAGKPFALASVRAGNVIGGGDWAQDRLVPDCVRAFHKKEQVHIRNPLAIRPWQHVLEPLTGYALLAKKMCEQPLSYSQAYNFGPKNTDALKVSAIAPMIADAWKAHGGFASVIVEEGDGLHEAGLLQLDSTKAQQALGFQPVWTAQTAIEKSTDWYFHFYNSKIDMKAYTLQQINRFIQDAIAKKITWALS